MLEDESLEELSIRDYDHAPKPEFYVYKAEQSTPIKAQHDIFSFNAGEKEFKTTDKKSLEDRDASEIHNEQDNSHETSNSHTGQSVFITGLKKVSKALFVSQNLPKFKTFDKSLSDEQNVKRGDRSIPEPPKQIIVSKSNSLH